MIKNKNDYLYYLEADRLARDYKKRLLYFGNRRRNAFV